MCAKAKEDKEAKAAKKAAAKEAKAAKAPKAKAKKKTAPPSEYNFFLLHGEKVAIAAAILVFGGLVAMGGGLEKFTLTADQINSSSKKAEETIATSKVTPKEFDESVVVYPYDAYAELIKSSVKVNAYETPVRWEQSLFPDKNKRPDVTPLPLENLRAQASIGAIMYNEISASGNTQNNGGGMMGGGMMGGAGAGMGMGMGGGKTEGRRWITITGSIPIRKQTAVYGDLFSDAQYLDDVRDQPRYVYYELQRGVVGPGGAVDWEKVDVIKAMRKENNQWAGVGSDQVGYNYMCPTVANFPPMAMSCPPMVSKPYGEEIANLPNIPLNSSEQIEIQADQLKEWNQLQDEMKQFDEATLLERDPFAGANAMGGAGMGMGMMGGMDGGMGGGMTGLGGAGGMGGGAGGMGGMDAAGGNSWMVNQNAISRSKMRVQAAVSVDYYLFRYFDFDVKPDVTYQYRVKLILANPNYGVKEEFVENTDSVTQRYIESEFSTASNPVALGADARVFAEKVEAATRPGAEPRITLSSVYFDEESASESIVQGQSLKRGQVANFYGQTHNPVDVQGGMSMDMMASGGKKGKNTKKSVNHISDVTVVDALGGAKIGGSELLSPGKVMILEPSGILEIRELKEDARELGRYDGSQNMMGGGMGGGMMM